MVRLLFPLVLFWSLGAHAGFIEIGGSANYRISRVDANNFQESTSYTGSLSYYFWELSALELSYTEGLQTVTFTYPPDKTIMTTLFRLTALDLVLTMAGKDSAFQPYIKMGGAYLQMKIVREVVGLSRDYVESPSGIVPSAGIGFKLKIVSNLSLKVGVDAWTSPLSHQPVTVDYAGRAGLSWMF